MITVAVLGIFGLIIAATFSLVKNRRETRKAAHEAAGKNVISDDLRRSFWFSGATGSGHGNVGDSSDDGGGDAGDSD